MFPKNKILMLALLAFLLIAWAGLSGAAEVKYDSGNRRDPFIPLEGGNEDTNKVPTTFKLEGIVYDPPEKSMALIGSQPCRVGDAVGGGKVLEIHKESVVIQIDNEKKTLWLREDDQPKSEGDMNAAGAKKAE